MNEQETRKVLAWISAKDPSFPRPDRMIVAAWHESLASVDVDAAARAVARHYDTHDRRITIADIRRRASADAPPYMRPAGEVLAAIEATIAAENAAGEIAPRRTRRAAIGAPRRDQGAAAWDIGLGMPV